MSNLFSLGEMQQALKIIGDIIHQMQKERGAAALFLDSGGKKFINEIQAQFKFTDRIIEALKKESEIWKKNKIIKAGIIEKIVISLENISRLEEQRKITTSLEQTSSKAMNYYTYDVIAHLLDIAVETALFDKKNDPERITAYSNFMYWKERAGRERAIGARGFLYNTFNNNEFVERMEFLVKEQESYRRTFAALASEQQLAALNKFLSDPAVLRIDKVHEHMEKAPGSKLLEAMTAEAWYEVMTHKIDLMQDVERALVNTLVINEKEELVHGREASTQQKHTVSNISQKHYDFIRTLPFFSGLSEKTLSDVLQHSQTREYKKGKLLFLEGELTTRFYIILSGWVKLFKGTVSGEEAILQMLSSGDTVAESAVFLNAPYPASGQVAENTVLLTFPAPIIREYIRSNNELAVNMLTSMSLRSQTFIHQIESTRLKSAKERVGWFLLKLLLNNDWESKGDLKLPYDKAMIASYLDMKPETFSRTLKLFKEYGFKIEKDTIIMPDAKSLCGYCDIDTAFQCSKSGTAECPN